MSLASVLATTISPDVFLSIRCTIPGRATPPMPDKLPRAVMQKGVDEGAVKIASGGMDNHSCRFVDDDEIDASS